MTKDNWEKHSQGFATYFVSSLGIPSPSSLFLHFNSKVWLIAAAFLYVVVYLT